MITHRISTEHDWICLEPSAARDWLVIDTGQEALIGDGVIGRVRVSGGRYETFRSTDPLKGMYFMTLDAAVDSFVPFGMRLVDSDSPVLASAAG